MALLKKLVRQGHTRYLVIPAAWLRAHERECGVDVTEVLVEVNGELRVRPFFSSRRMANVSEEDKENA